MEHQVVPPISGETLCGDKRVYVGTWACPSGISVEVYRVKEAAGLGYIELWWESSSPLEAEDNAFIVKVIMPEAVRGLREVVSEDRELLAASNE